MWRRKDRLRPRALKFDGKGRLTRLTNWSAYDILRKRVDGHPRESRNAKGEGEVVQRKGQLSTRKRPFSSSSSLYSFRGKSKEKWRGNGSNWRKDKIRFAARLSTRSRVELVYKVPRPRVYYILCLFVAVSAGWRLHPQNKEKERVYTYIYTVGETFPSSGESRGREFLTRRTKAFELAAWSGGRCAMMKLHKRSGCSMVLVKWLALCAIREKKREKERKREMPPRLLFLSTRRAERQKFTIVPFRSREEDRRRPRSWTKRFRRCLGIAWKEKGGRSYGLKKADENWPGIDRDRWHLTWHLTNCEISLLRRGIIADQRSIYFSQPRVFISPSNENQIAIGNSISPLPTRPSPRRIKRRKDGRPRKECDRLSASICLDRKIASRRPSIEESLAHVPPQSKKQTFESGEKKFIRYLWSIIKIPFN